MRKVAIIMGSDSDWPVVKGACGQLDAQRADMAKQIAEKEAKLQAELSSL